jgi:hypothetical protein
MDVQAVPGTAVWVVSGPGLPAGARVLGDDAAAQRIWLDVCVFGQHLPQMYRIDEISDLDRESCPRLGLCEDCLGFGDLAPGVGQTMMQVNRGVDQLSRACPGCGGSGRPALRVTVARSASGTTGVIRPVPHGYVEPLPAGRLPEAAAILIGLAGGPAGCLACGMPRDGVGPRDEALHP